MTNEEKMAEQRTRLADLRKEYTHAGLDRANADDDPFVQFRRWFDEAVAAGIYEPNAMTLATATSNGRPSARVVLLKGLEDGGFTFYTNYGSRKGQELTTNPYAALTFFWVDLERQVRIEGHVEQVASATSDAYFASRPLGSQLGAWASEQSQVIGDRAALDRRMAELSAMYGDGPVPRPPHWGGFQVVPHTVEFWQGRPSRLHDRLRYSRTDDGRWIVERLAP
jgi:pyridoxamine 5'-phosphate oxidase